jgi:hypothetical protein
VYNSLTLSNNSKTSFFPEHKNTFGLMFGLPENGGTCPGATNGKGGCMEVITTATGTTRRTCYMDKIVRIYPNAGKTLVNNTLLLRDKTEEEMVPILRNTVLKWLLNGGYKQQYFRLHYSGDFFSEEYARAWVKVIKEFPTVRFWVYTRSFDVTKAPFINVIPIIAECKNLAVYLSCDQVNYKVAMNQVIEWNNVGLAFMGNNVPEELSEAKKFVQCPEITKKIKNDKDAGACSKCKLCFTYNDKIKLRNIQFKIH